MENKTIFCFSRATIIFKREVNQFLNSVEQQYLISKNYDKPKRKNPIS